MEELGLSVGRSTPCTFHHKSRNIRAVAHGDDFTALGYEPDLDWFRKMISERYEVKFRGRLGPGRNDDKSVRILNRIVEWSDQGISYEADQRHAGHGVRRGFKCSGHPRSQVSGRRDIGRAVGPISGHEIQSTGGKGKLPVSGQVGHSVLGQGAVQEHVCSNG
jgi:hypothetical protein